MRYFLSSNLKTLRRNLPTYLPTCAFITAGMTVLFVLLCGLFSYLGDLNERTRYAKGMDFIIVNDWVMSHEQVPPDYFSAPKKGRYMPSEDSALLPSDLMLIEERLGGRASFMASLVNTFSIMPKDIRYEYEVAFVSPDFFSPLDGLPEGDFILGSKELLLNTAEFSTPGGPRYFALQQFPYIFDPERQVFTDLEGGGEIKMVFFEDVINLSDFDLSPFFSLSEIERRPQWDRYLFIPMKHYFDVYQPYDNSVIEMRAGAQDMSALYELLAILNENHKGKVTYGFDELSSIFVRNMDEQVQLAAVAAPATLIFMLVIGMNFMGLQLLSIRRRSRDFAIQMACGAKAGHITGGALFLSLFTVTLAAALASGLGAVAVGLLDIRLYNVLVTIKWLSVLPVFGFGWLIGGLSCLPTVLRLSRLSPVDILSGQ